MCFFVKKKIKFFCTIISYLFLFIMIFGFNHGINIRASCNSSYFQRSKKQKFLLLTEKDLIAYWLEQEPALHVHNYYVANKKQIIDLMFKRYKVHIRNIPDIPSYNDYSSSYMKYLEYSLKDPENGLMGVYIEKRINPFGRNYPLGNFKYTLDDLKKCSLEIKNIYCFWDINKKLSNLDVKIHYIDDEIDIKKTSVQKFILDYLKSNKIISNEIFVEKNCYNLFSEMGLVMPLPTDLIKQGINGIYYDNGSWRNNQNIDKYIDDKGADISYIINNYNGSRNIYIFRIKEYKGQTTKNIILEPHLNPEERIQEWLKQQKISLEYKTFVDINKNDYYTISQKFTFFDKDNNDVYVVTVPQLHMFDWFYPEGMKNTINRFMIDRSIFDFIDETKLYQKLEKYRFEYYKDSFCLLNKTDYMGNIYIQLELQNGFNDDKFHIILKLDKEKTFDKLQHLYEEEFKKWKNHCPFQPYNEYSGLNIYNKRATNHEYIYTDKCNTIYNFSYEKYYYPIYDAQLRCYKLKFNINEVNTKEFIEPDAENHAKSIISYLVKVFTNIFVDGVYFNDDKKCPVQNLRDAKFNGFFSFYPPPLKPLQSDL